jgi:outer membrane protein assembly factor BamB
MPRCTIQSLSNCAWLALITVIVGCSPLDIPEGQIGDLSTDAQRSEWSGWPASAQESTVFAGGTAFSGPGFSGANAQTLWQIAIPQGTSSPTIWGEQIWLTFETPSKEVGIQSLGLDGKTLWSQTLATASGATHYKTGYAAATPATDGRNIYASFGRAGLFCLSTDGKLIWQAGAHQVDHDWGHASSPILAGDLLIQVVDGSERSFIAAYDGRTGKKRWSTPRFSNGCWSSPTLFIHPTSGREEIVVNGSGRDSGVGEVTAYALSTGVVTWSVPGTSNTPAPTALIFEDLVISATGNNGPIFAVQVDAQGQATTKWRLPAGGPYVPTGVVVDDLFVQIEDGGRLTGYSATDGERRWSVRLRGSFTASLVNLGDEVVATSEDGTLHFVSFDRDSCQLTGTYPLGERVLATPIEASGMLFVRTASHLHCLGNSRPPAGLADHGGSRIPSGVVMSVDGKRAPTVETAVHHRADTAASVPVGSE